MPETPVATREQIVDVLRRYGHLDRICAALLAAEAESAARLEIIRRILKETPDA